MSRITIEFKTPAVFKTIAEFTRFLRYYLKLRGYSWFTRFEGFKNFFVDILYKKRGRYARPFLHLGMVGLITMVVTVGPIALDSADADEQKQPSAPVLSTATAYAPDFLYLASGRSTSVYGGEKSSLTL